jgi:hypothetical protein
MVLLRTEQVYDGDCQVIANHMTLEAVQVAAIQGCSNEGCVLLIVAAAAVTAVSAVISGTVVVVGNVAYWVERNAQCHRVP